MSALKTTFLSLIASVALASCQCNSLRIDGTLSSAPDGSIYLSVLDSAFRWTKIDTATIKDGRFAFTPGFSLSQPECLLLTVGTQNMVLFAANSSLTVEGSILQPEKMKVTGSADNDAFVAFNEQMPGRERLAQLNAVLGAVNNDVDRRDEIANEIKSLQQEQADYLRRAILANKDNAIGLFGLVNNIRLFSFDEVEAMLAAFREKIPDHKYFKSLERIINERRNLSVAMERIKNGNEAPDFVLANEHGDTLRLSSLRGTSVLLCFWRADVPMCRRENEALARLYPMLRQSEVEVVGIHVGGSRQEWLKAKDEDHMPGYQLFDDGTVAAQYCVSQVPLAFLIDEAGAIVSKDMARKSIFQDLDLSLF